MGNFFSDVGDFFGDVGDFFSDKLIDPIKEAAKYTPFTGFGAFQEGGPGSRVGAQAGIHTADVTAANKDRDQAERDARAAADARIAQTEYEEQAAKGLSRAKARRRRGFQSTMLTGGPTTLGGATLADSGKTLLGS